MLEEASNLEENFEVYYEESELPIVPNRIALKELYFELLGV
jgi:hypothetical protein